MLEQKAYNKYQISKMIDKWQVVIRTDDYKELVSAMEEMKPLIEQIEKKELEKRAPEVHTGGSQPALTSICPTHNVEMQPKTGMYGTYWSHTIPEVGFCNGKKITPFKKQ